MLIGIDHGTARLELPGKNHENLPRECLWFALNC
jgi:hypothetical protein